MVSSSSGDVVELVDTLVLEASAVRHVGSSPTVPTTRITDDIPDDASLEDIQYHIYVREKIDHGLKHVKAGKVLSQDEVEERMAKWLGK